MTIPTYLVSLLFAAPIPTLSLVSFMNFFATYSLKCNVYFFQCRLYTRDYVLPIYDDLFHVTLSDP